MVYTHSFPGWRLPSRLWSVSFAGHFPAAPSTRWFLPCFFFGCSGELRAPPASQPRACSLLPQHLFLQTPPSGAPSKWPGHGATFTTVDFLLFLWLPHWLHADVFLLSEPLPPARAAFCWRFLGSRPLGSASRHRGAALPMCIFRVCALHFAPTFPGKWSFEKDLVVLTWYLGTQRHKFWFTQSSS